MIKFITVATRDRKDFMIDIETTKTTDFFYNISRNSLDDNVNVMRYRNDIEEEKNKLENFRLGMSSLYILRHPIACIRINRALRKVNDTSLMFEHLINSDLENFVDFTLDLEYGLTEALMYNKPTEIERFISENPVKKLTINRNKLI